MKLTPRQILIIDAWVITLITAVLFTQIGHRVAFNAAALVAGGIVRDTVCAEGDALTGHDCGITLMIPATDPKHIWFWDRQSPLPMPDDNYDCN